MKVYRVVDKETGNVRSVWTRYRSAAGSAAQASNVEVQVAHIGEDAWAPVNKAQESRLHRVNNLWHQVAHMDPRDAQETLEALQRKLEGIVRARNPKPPAPQPLWGEAAAREADALLRLNQLVA